MLYPNRILTWRWGYGIKYDTVDARQIRRLRRRIERLHLHKANVRHRQLASIALSVGRQLRKGGKEPTFAKHGRPPLTIPNHPGPMSPITVDDILDRLEEDLDYEEGIADA